MIKTRWSSSPATSANGPWLNFGNHAGSAGGLREGKGTSFEGGQREPCIVRWQSVIPEGKICNQLCSTIDLFPTIAKLTDASLPEHKIDGLDISTLLFHPASPSPRTTFYYYYRKNALEAVRKDQCSLLPAQSDAIKSLEKTDSPVLLLKMGLLLQAYMTCDAILRSSMMYPNSTLKSSLN